MTPREPKAFEAAARLADEHGLPHDEMVVLKDGSNLLVHLAPSPVVLRIATFTAQIRGDPLPWLRREVSVVSYLASVGAAVMPPSERIPPGPHVIGGWPMNAWAYVDHARGVVPDALATLRALDELHEQLRGYPGELPLLNPAKDDLDRAVGFGLALGVFSADRAAELVERRDTLVASLLAHDDAIQAQHGDAFPRNSLLTKRGIVWIDFEDCCAGPVLWDLGTLIRQGGGEPVARIVRARYGGEAVRVAVALRDLQLETWMALHDVRPPARRSQP